MKTTIEIELHELPEGNKWELKHVKRGNREIDITYQMKMTHREDGTPLDIPELPEMPDNVERVEYFGVGMKPEDMGDADGFIAIMENVEKNWGGLNQLTKL